MVVASTGIVYVSDGAQHHAVAVDAQGHITRTFGRKGRGPGEFSVPTSVALAGDTMLLVRDAGQLRVHKFDTRTGTLIGTTRLPAGSGRLRVLGDDLLVAAFDADSQSSLTRLTSSGATTMQGGLPSYARQHVMMLSPFPSQAFVVVDRTVFAISELSTALVTWPLGTRQVTGFELPKTLRRGVNLADYDAMLQDPAKAAQLAYRHSVPMLLERMDNGYLVAAMYDVDLVGAAFTGRFYLSLIDVRGHRACVDIPVPVPEDPPARLALAGDTLIAIVQSVAGNGAAATIRRWQVNPAACSWIRPHRASIAIAFLLSEARSGP
jgi:hypothetical protein